MKPEDLCLICYLPVDECDCHVLCDHCDDYVMNHNPDGTCTEEALDQKEWLRKELNLE